jgi:hypothetical protein
VTNEVSFSANKTLFVSNGVFSVQTRLLERKCGGKETAEIAFLSAGFYLARRERFLTGQIPIF